MTSGKSVSIYVACKNASTVHLQLTPSAFSIFQLKTSFSKLLLNANLCWGIMQESLNEKEMKEVGSESTQNYTKYVSLSTTISRPH